jgi:allantoinase
MDDRTVNVIRDTGHDRAEPGMDHQWFDFSHVPARTLPEGHGLAPLTLNVVVDLTAVEWEHPDARPIIAPPGGRGLQAFPDLPRMSHREYGHRVGAFRLLGLLEGVGVPPAAAVDVLTAERYPALNMLVRDRIGEVVAGGISASRPITSRMEEDEERDYVATTLDRLESALDVRPEAWLSPQRSQSVRTPRLLAAAGVVACLDWGNDEQPYRFHGAADGLWAAPLSWELSDLSACYVREVPEDRWAASLVEAAEGMLEDGRRQPRVLGLHLHPWITGQPYASAPLREALSAIVAMPGVEVALPSVTLGRFAEALRER